MTDKDDVHMPVPADQKYVQQHEESLGEILHRFDHRTRHVHQAKHYCFSIRTRYALETVVANIERIDIGNDLAPVLEPLKFSGEPFRIPLAAAGASFLDRLADGVQLPGFGPPQRDAPSHAVAHCPANAQIGRTAGDGVAGTLQIDREGLLETLFHQIWQLQILEKHVKELFLGQRELERILPGSVRAALRSASPLAAGRPRNLVASEILFVAGNDVLGATGAPAVVKDRLGNPARRDRDFLALPDIGDLALAQRLLHRRFDLGPGTPEEALAIAQALAFGVGSAVDDVHFHCPPGARLPRRPYPALFTRIYHSTSRRTCRSV